MNEGMAISDLKSEVFRMWKTKKDYVVKARDLHFTSMYESKVEPVDPGSTLVSVDGGQHVANAEWYNERIGRGVADRLARVLAETEPKDKGNLVTTLDLPMRVDKETGSMVYSPLAVNDLAHTQLSAYLGVPKQFYTRLRYDHPELLGETVNTLLHAKPDSDYRMIRTLDAKVRAVLSDSYEPMDNFDLLQFLQPLIRPKRDDKGNLLDTELKDGTVIEYLRDPNGLFLPTEFVSCNVTENDLHIKLTVPKMQVELKVGTTVRAGAIIGNGEVGNKSLFAYPFFEVLQCTNGAFIVDYGNRRRHVGRAKGGEVGNALGSGDDGNDAPRWYADQTKRARDKSYFLQMVDIVRRTLTEASFKQMLEPIRASMGVKITGNPEAAVEVTSRLFDLTEGETEGVLRNLIDDVREEGMTQFALCQAVTKHSNMVENYGRSTELQGIGGEIATMSEAEFQEIATAKKVRRAGSGPASSFSNN